MGGTAPPSARAARECSNGYKIDAAVDVATGLPLALSVRSAKHAEQNFALALIDAANARRFSVQTAIMDKGYDSNTIHAWS